MKTMKSSINPLSLAVLSTLLHGTQSMGQQERTLKEKIAYKKFGNQYLKKAIESFAVDPSKDRAVQELKHVLQNFPDPSRYHHPYRYAMPPQNKQAYTEKRMEALRRLTNAKMHRASKKLKTNLKQSKRSKMQKRYNSHFGTKR